jgi:lipopolysaccharide export system protein LptC
MVDFASRRTLDRIVAWLPILLLAGLAALTWWLDSQVQDAGPRRDGNARHDPDLFAEGVRGVELDETGQPVQTLAAARARHYPDDGTVEFDDPRFLLTQPGRPPFRVQADRARVAGDRERAFFEGNVRATREADAGNGETGPVSLDTSYLEVIPKQDRALTDRPVTITEARGIIRATGLDLDNQAKTAKLKSEVRGTFAPPAR